MRRLFWLTLALAMTGAIGMAQTSPPPRARRAQVPAQAAPAPQTPTFDREAYRIPHTRFVLDNGLTLLVHEDHSSPVVAVNLWYHVGSRNEQRGRTGFAHLFEHFFFNGSEHYPKGFREAMDDLGATNRNGTTDTDRTNFFEDVPVSALERTLYLEADRMGFLAGQINQAMLTRERGVVQNEKRQSEDRPYGRDYSRIVERMYPPSHPYSWPTIGSMEDLNAATLDDIRTWYATHYGPNNCVLSLAGDITPTQALALVKKYFDGIKPGPPAERLERWIPRLEANVRERVDARVPQTRIYRVYHAPAWRDADVDALDVAASVLSGSRSARLDRRLVYDEELATAVSAGAQTSELSGLFIVNVTLKAGVEPSRVESIVDATIAEFLQQGPTESELQRARSRILGAFSRRTERLGGFGGRSDILAEAATFDGTSDGYLLHLERTALATAARVKETARRWLDAPHYTLVVTPSPTLAAGQTSVDRSVLPALGAPPEVAFPALTRTTLSNGLKVVLLERHSAPLVNMTLAVDAGYASDTAATAGMASLALDLLDDGTNTRDSFGIVDALDTLGAQVTTGSSLDLSFVRLRALRSNLRPSLAVYADVILHPSFPQSMVELAKQQRITQIAQEKAQPVGLAQRVLAPLLYGGEHPYGTPFTGTGYERTVTGITQAQLRAWHQTWFKPSSATLIVAGDVTMAALRPELERAFGSWARGSAPVKRVSVAPAPGPAKVYLVDAPGATQSVIVAAHLTEPGGQPAELALDAVMQNFGGLPTSRLNRNLRLDKQWAYATQGLLLAARGPRTFIAIAPVQADKTRESMVEIQKELKDITGNRPIRGDEFDSLMRSQTLALPGRFATLASLENAAVQIVNYGYSDDYFSTYASRVRGLTPPALATAAQAYIKPADVIWVVVGDLAKVEGGVRALGLGPTVRIDGDGRAQ